MKRRLTRDPHGVATHLALMAGGVTLAYRGNGLATWYADGRCGVGLFGTAELRCGHGGFGGIDVVARGRLHNVRCIDAGDSPAPAGLQRRGAAFQCVTSVYRMGMRSSGDGRAPWDGDRRQFCCAKHGGIGTLCKADYDFIGPERDAACR